jgi:hypothetical protein
VTIDPSTGDVIDNVDNGGAYDAGPGLTTMQGRPGTVTQSFGSRLLNASGQPQLPAPVAPEYAPANEDDLDYFDFANVHETGHAVDDRMRFMTSREGNAAFGGWITHGGNIQPIVTQVMAKHAASVDDSVKSQVQQYLIDKIGGASPDKPAVAPTLQTQVNNACREIDTWHGIASAMNAWWSQSSSTTLTMLDGRIYHEAYAKTWVSYIASERAKGITGYQFRAPAEWFAELFASYHMKKLKPSHPACVWLADLKI